MGPRGVFLITLLFIIAVVIVSVILISNYSNNSIINEDQNSNQEPPENNENSESNNENQEVTQPTNTPSEVPAGGGGGGGGSGGSSGGGEAPENCQTEDISYSFLDFNRTEVCNSFEINTSICNDKTISCKVNVENREQTIGGIFKLELNFINRTDNSVIETRSSEFFLGPQETYQFEEILNVQSSGQDGVANQKLGCSYENIEVPQKCVA